MTVPRWAAWRLALGTVTVLPTGAVRVTPGVARSAMVLVPVAALPLGAAAGAAGWAGSALRLPELVVGLLVVAVLALGTRALHLDGLADTVDGLGSGWDSERALAVMRRGDIGPMGVVALVLVLGVQAGLAGALIDGGGGAVLVAALVVGSRCAVPAATRRGVPAARLDGLGAAVAGTVPGGAVVLGWLAAAALVSGAAVLGGRPWWLGAATVAVAAAAVELLVRRSRRRLGGVTGDVLGAAVETAFTALLLSAAVITGTGR